MTPSERIVNALVDNDKRAAFIPYLMGGFPDHATSVAIGWACANNGADVLEVGIPFSDPLADGPVIQAASNAALQARATPSSVIEAFSELSERLPLVAMCYANLVIHPGVRAFVDLLVDSGFCGLIVPDLPVEEGDELRTECDKRGLALIPLVAPTTPDPELSLIGANARGFLYTVAVTGTTGESSSHSQSLADLITRAMASTSVPISVGFGVSTPDEVRKVANLGADGVIVGSRLVREAAEADDPAKAVGELVREMVKALRV
jgi:tryptophan synthase alpha chain